MEYVYNAIYYCNGFNKDKADSLGAVAKDFMNMKDEDDIFEDILLKAKDRVIGMPKWLEDVLMSHSAKDFWTFLNDNMTALVEWTLNSLNYEVKRFNNSLIWIMATTLIYGDKRSIDIKNIYDTYSTSMFEQATLKGSMSGSEVSMKSPSVKAFSSVVEGCIRYSTGFESGEVPVSDVLGEFQYDLDVSIWTLIVIQFCNGEHHAYACRITDKNQIGYREISSLNFNYRLGALFVDITEIASAKDDKEDILLEPKKEKVIADNVQKLLKKFSVMSLANKMVKPIVVFFNEDHKRWGPNIITLTFIAIDTILFRKDTSIIRLRTMVYLNVLSKTVKFPEQVIKYFKSKKRLTASMNESNLKRFLMRKFGRINETSRCTCTYNLS